MTCGTFFEYLLAHGVVRVAREADVSHAWFYAEPDIRHAVQELRDQTTIGRSTPIPSAQRATIASLRTRLEAANARNHELATEITNLRDQIAHLHGELRAAQLRGELS